MIVMGDQFTKFLREQGRVANFADFKRRIPYLFWKKVESLGGMYIEEDHRRLRAESKDAVRYRGYKFNFGTVGNGIRTRMETPAGFDGDMSRERARLQELVNAVCGSDMFLPSSLMGTSKKYGGSLMLRTVISVDKREFSGNISPMWESYWTVAGQPFVNYMVGSSKGS